ncbi:LacI family DNA-binding transcriptional regulator [Quadrisphaera setariae]|uniref:LacI family transcriptional regulator n=1 Tax=Quadrisphaera setariae TaxID=2593304 RepID=A0A5C8Z278_9ACTN|nr:LacI family DNA-binding transcriptional regulator [Quadrisphaera setariae]TXR51303.1 LacI family transcriptional regulator [Quadrisphaera setariae]
MARRAGVSKATASKALNGRPDVGHATRAKVMAIAEELKFTPNEAARSLMSGRTQTVGLLTNDLEGRFALPLMIGAEDALGEAETMALMANSRGRADLETAHLHALLRRRVDGIVLVGDAPEAREPLGEELAVPAVYAYAPSRREGDISVLVDHRADGHLAAEHLISQGRGRIAHIAGPFTAGENGNTAAQLRAAGTLDALSAHGLELIGGPPRSGDWTEQWGWQEAERLLDSHDVDGFVCGNDQIARGTVDLLISRGVPVPEDVAVIGFDNWQQIAAHNRLPQSTVEMNLYEVGRMAARAVLQPGFLDPGHHLVTGKLIVRRSSSADA